MDARRAIGDDPESPRYILSVRGIDAAAACLRFGDFEEVQRSIDRVIAWAEATGARPELARALALAGCVLLRVGDIPAGRIGQPEKTRGA